MSRTYFADESPAETVTIVMAGHCDLLAYRLAVN
ncbi:hypothetical protein FraEuI1c_6941 [Pseudofrankia inefficax]|uniref:Uncharacterized protein n=1 Tax=Pseudofrankia inefficax (strain DSM 45817 / CECT 9037 / DDB 130130 / EuI1c) TaxID=298654 RepID=E3IVY1_PSEI1|nr:hypothetical protein FraEuI1c_6941 [Pseudofrankia inefficax]